MFRIGQRDHLALTRFADQQHAARAEDQHARAVHFFGENRDVESRRRFQLREIEGVCSA
jgi:Arc/MetJ family transcription regulator